MKVYIAAPIKTAPQMREIRKSLGRNGIEVTSRWIDQPSEKVGYDNVTREFLRGASVLDLEDVDAADVRVHFQLYPSGGASFEGGYALAKGKRVIVIGKFCHVFNVHPDIEFYEVEASDVAELDQYINIAKEVLHGSR